MNHFFLQTILVFSIIISFHPAIYAKDLSKKELKEKIINAWLENSAKIDSYRFKYELEFTYHKGMANYYYRLRKDKDLPALPEKEITLKRNSEIIASLEKIKNINYGDEYHYIKDKIYSIADQRIIASEHQFYFAYYAYVRPFPYAWFYSKRMDFLFLEDIIWIPIKIITKPFSHELYSDDANCNPYELKVISKELTEDGLLEISVPTIANNISSLNILLNPAQKYLPVKISYKIKDKDPIYHDRTEKWTISKWKKIDDILVPEYWVYQGITPNGKTVKTIRCKAIQIELNKSIPDTEFKMKIPPGTKVENHIKKEFYVIQKNGFKRTYPEDAMNKPTRENNYEVYKVLMNPKYNHLKTTEEIDAVLKKNQ